MEISSRQIVALGAPLIVTYLTWSALSSRVTTLVQMKKNLSVATGAVSKRPHIDQLARNPFAPIGAADEDVPSDFDGAADSGDAATLHLDGTAVRGNWRMAIINGERVFEGQTYRRHFHVQEVTTDAVTLKGPGGETLRLSLDIAPAPVAPSSASGQPAVVPDPAAALAAGHPAAVLQNLAAVLVTGQLPASTARNAGADETPKTVPASQGEPKSSVLVPLARSRSDAEASSQPQAPGRRIDAPR